MEIFKTGPEDPDPTQICFLVFSKKYFLHGISFPNVNILWQKLNRIRSTAEDSWLNIVDVFL